MLVSAPKSGELTYRVSDWYQSGKSLMDNRDSAQILARPGSHYTSLGEGHNLVEGFRKTFEGVSCLIP